MSKIILAIYYPQEGYSLMDFDSKKEAVQYIKEGNVHSAFRIFGNELSIDLTPNPQDNE